MKESYDAVFLVVFFLLVFCVPWAAARATYSENSRLDLRDLWVHNQRIDVFRVIILGTWWVHTCSMILWTLVGDVKTQDYATYMAWALPIMAKMFAPSPQPSSETTTTSSTTSSSTVSPAP